MEIRPHRQAQCVASLQFADRGEDKRMLTPMAETAVRPVHTSPTHGEPARRGVAEVLGTGIGATGLGTADSVDLWQR